MYGESSLVNSGIKLFYDASWLMKQIFLVLEVSSYRNRIAGELKQASPLVMYAKRISPEHRKRKVVRRVRNIYLVLPPPERFGKQIWNLIRESARQSKSETNAKTINFCADVIYEKYLFFFIVSSVGFSILVPYRLLENFTYCCFLIAFYWNLLWRLVCKKKLIWFSFLLFSDCLGLWCRVYARRENSGKSLLLWAVTSDL